MWWIFGAIAALYFVRSKPATVTNATTVPDTSTPAAALGTPAGLTPVVPALRSPANWDGTVVGMRMPIDYRVGTDLPAVRRRDPIDVPARRAIASESEEMSSHFWADDGGTAEFILRNPDPITVASSASQGGSGAGGGGGGAAGGGGGTGGGGGHLK